jgi:hypothetical protein
MLGRVLVPFVFYTADRAMIFGNGLVVVVEPLTKIAGLLTSGVSF